MKKSLAAKVLPKSVQDDIDRQIEPHLKVRASGVGLCVLCSPQIAVTRTRQGFERFLYFICSHT